MGFVVIKNLASEPFLTFLATLINGGLMNQALVDTVVKSIRQNRH